MNLFLTMVPGATFAGDGVGLKGLMIYFTLCFTMFNNLNLLHYANR